MKGLELCEKFYNECGRPMLEHDFGDVLPFCAVGVAGSGSECLGYDDDVSRDHDFEPGFCIFLPDESVVDRRVSFELERAYARLPREFEGFSRQSLAAVGGARHGVIRMSEFFEAKTGKSDGALSLFDWISVPEQALLEAVNGKVFYDAYGEFTKTRESLAYMPEDARLKKLASNLLALSQAGQYNYPRCVGRGETGAACLAVNEFVLCVMHVIFLLNKRYMPYYKWSFCALRELEIGSDVHTALEWLMSSPNGETETKEKTKSIESLCATLGKELYRRGLLRCETADAELMAYEVNSRIRDVALRNAHILAAL